MMDFLEIDKKRRKAHVSIKAVCRLAGMSTGAWYRIEAGKIFPRRKTLDRLSAAVDIATAKSQPRAVATDLIRSTFNGYVVAFCRHHAITPEAVLASDPALRATANAEWQAAAKIRALAVYCIVIEFNLTGAAVARAIGLTRAGTSLILKRVEDLRDDPGTDAMIEKIGILISGRAA